MSALAVEPRQLTELEQQWVTFLRGLEPWEHHRLHQLGELYLHDQYMANMMSLQEIFVKVCIEGEEDQFSKRVP